MGTTYYVILGATRIANANREDQSGSDDGNVTGWDKANDFILATRIYTSKGPIPRAYKLRWRDVTDEGVFADVGSSSEITFNAVTVLVDGNPVVIGEKLCDAEGGYTWQEGEENEEDNILPDSGTFSLADEYYTEFQWALDCSNAEDNHVYEFELWDVTEGASVGTCLATITMAGGQIINIDVTAAVGANAAKQLSQALNVSKTAGVQGGATDAQVSTLNINKEDIVDVDAIDEVLQILNIDKTAAVNVGTSFLISKVQIITKGAGVEADASLNLTLVFVIDENADVNVAATLQLGVILNINKTAAVNVGAVDDVKRYVHINNTADVEADVVKDIVWDLTINKNADVLCGTMVIVTKVGGTPAGAAPGPGGSSSGIRM